MFIGICGGICAGKSSIANYLIQERGFQRVYLNRSPPAPAIEKSVAGLSSSNGQFPSGPPDEFCFDDPEQLLDFVTSRWNERWLTTDIWDEAVVDVYSRRPFFFLISVDAPVTVRWQRFKKKCLSHGRTPPDLKTFVINNDAHVYSHVGGLAMLRHRARLHLLNSTSSIKELNSSLSALELTNESRLRPSWDQYFMQLASLAAQRCNCMKRQVGCVLVRENRVISTGYNGTPRGMKNCGDGGCPRCNSGQGSGKNLDTCLCLHAEENALLEAGRERIREGSTLYCNTCPCLTCSVKIAQVGIGEVVYSQEYSVDAMAASILEGAGVKLRQFSPPRVGLVDLGSEKTVPILDGKSSAEL